MSFSVAGSWAFQADDDRRLFADRVFRQGTRRKSLDARLVAVDLVGTVAIISAEEKARWRRGTYLTRRCSSGRPTHGREKILQLSR